MGGTTTLVILISACFAGLCLIVGLAIGIPRSRRKHKEIKRLKQIVDNETQQADQIGEELVADADTVSLGDASIANREDSQPVEQFPTQEQPSELYGQPMGEYGYNAPMHGQNLAGENHGQYYPYRGNYPFPPQPRYMPYQQRPPVQYQPNPGYGYPTRQYPYQPNPQWQTPNPQ